MGRWNHSGSLDANLRKRAELRGRGRIEAGAKGLLTDGGGAELVPADANGGAGALGADNAARDYQLHGRDILEQSGPGDRDFDARPGRELTSGVKKHAAAG